MAETSADSGEYQPGVCNIGTAERQRRRRTGHLGSLAGVALLLAVGGLGLPPYYGLASTVFFIAGAVGYLQDRYQFCAYYGQRGEYNLGGLDQSPETVTDEAARRRDRQRSREIYAYSLVAGLGVGLLGTGILYLL